MTDIRSNTFAARKSERLVLASGASVLQQSVRWTGRSASVLLKLLCLIPATLGRAFEMAYVDPFNSPSSHQDHERR